MQHYPSNGVPIQYQNYRASGNEQKVFQIKTRVYWSRMESIPKENSWTNNLELTIGRFRLSLCRSVPQRRFPLLRIQLVNSHGCSSVLDLEREQIRLYFLPNLIFVLVVYSRLTLSLLHNEKKPNNGEYTQSWVREILDVLKSHWHQGWPSEINSCYATTEQFVGVTVFEQ